MGQSELPKSVADHDQRIAGVRITLESQLSRLGYQPEEVAGILGRDRSGLERLEKFHTEAANRIWRNLQDAPVGPATARSSMQTANLAASHEQIVKTIQTLLELT